MTHIIHPLFILRRHFPLSKKDKKPQKFLEAPLLKSHPHHRQSSKLHQPLRPWNINNRSYQRGLLPNQQPPAHQKKLPNPPHNPHIVHRQHIPHKKTPPPKNTSTLGLFTNKNDIPVLR